MSSQQGWGLNGITRKVHYYKDRRSLCGKYGSIGVIDLEDDKDDHPENCADCKKRVKKLREQQTPPRETRELDKRGGLGTG